jgi:hypothetical protein
MPVTSSGKGPPDGSDPRAPVDPKIAERRGDAKIALDSLRAWRVTHGHVLGSMGVDNHLDAVEDQLNYVATQLR